MGRSGHSWICSTLTEFRLKACGLAGLICSQSGLTLCRSCHPLKQTHIVRLKTQEYEIDFRS